MNLPRRAGGWGPQHPPPPLRRPPRRRRQNRTGQAHARGACGASRVSAGRFARDAAVPMAFGQPLLLLCVWHVPTSTLLRVLVLGKADTPHAAALGAGVGPLDARGARGVLQLVSGSDEHGPDMGGRLRAVAPSACLFSVREKLFLFD